MEDAKLLTFGSLFAGIGGFDLGLERTGMHCQWQVEIDDYATKVLEKHWPDVTRFRDVRDVGRHNLADVDLICGGFPCQDISNAGKRAGIEGERSGLWFEYARIIRELRPRFVLVENVAALLGRGIERVLGDLAACGYDAEWRVFSACEMGFPHSRERLFLIAYPAEVRRSSKRPILEFSTPIIPRDHDTQKRCYDWLFPQVDYTNVVVETWGPEIQGTIEPALLQLPDGVSPKLGSISGFGNAVVPQVAEWIGKRIIESQH